MLCAQITFFFTLKVGATGQQDFFTGLFCIHWPEMPK